MTCPDRIYREFHPRVLAYVRGRVHHSDAEDVASTVFLKVCANLHRYDAAKASLSTWIYTITRNAVFDHLRRQKGAPLPLEENVRIEDMPAGDMDGMLEALSDALDTLPGKQKDVIILHYYFGYSHMEIAGRLRVSYANARKICSMALAELRKKLSE